MSQSQLELCRKKGPSRRLEKFEGKKKRFIMQRNERTACVTEVKNQGGGIMIGVERIRHFCLPKIIQDKEMLFTQMLI